MGSGAHDTPEPTRLYSKLSPEQQAEFGKVVIEKLRTLIGGYGELSVLAEYIAVMLQSSRPPEQIQSELEAFLQDQSPTFTEWLCRQLAKHAGEDQGPPPDAKGEALLLRAVQDARQGAAAAEGGAVAAGGKSRRREGGEKERRTSRAREKRAHREKQAAAVQEPVAREKSAEPAATGRHRSRSRRGRRRDKAAEGGKSRRKEAVLTPNVQFLRDAYHSKKQGQTAAAAPAALAAAPAATLAPAPAPAPAAPQPPPDTRWAFRAEPAPAANASPFSWQASPPAPHAGPPHAAISPFAHPSEPRAPERPRRFPVKKWRVARANTVVRATEHLHSEEIQMLQEGEIVEQVAPPFKLKNGIVRLQIRHPSSPQFPNPIGWVTQDATAAGGPKFLEPGPEPMQKPAWRPPSAATAPPPGSWRPRHPGPPTPAPRGPPGIKSTPYGYQNLIWTPGGSKSSEAITIPG